MFEEIVLEQEQIDLLSSFIEIIRNVPREKRIKFIGSQMSNGTSHVMHPYAQGKYVTALLGDVEILNNEGLINLSFSSSSSFNFDIMPKGFKYYEYQQTKEIPVSEKIEKPLRNFLNGNRFQSSYPAAYDKWSKAESKIWSNDSQDELSIIGILCREAMQEFVTSLVDKYQPVDVDTNKSHDVARLKCILAQRANHIPKTIAPFIDAITIYWGTLNDLVQRQVHAAQKEGSVVSWEDAKRIVFHTAVVFLEVDKILSTTA
jgi:hypothetical protein